MNPDGAGRSHPLVSNSGFDMRFIRRDNPAPRAPSDQRRSRLETSVYTPGSLGRGGLSVQEIAPESTDPAIDQWLDPHLVAFDARAATRNQLFLFLCGSHGQPSRQRLITALAARMGYHAVNLRYPNAWTIGGLCRPTGDTGCHRKLRLEILDGHDRTGLLRIGSANSIQHRLTKLLLHLARHEPDLDWAQFLGPDGVRWDRSLVAGHSQGGGHAGIIGKEHRVLRVVMFAAPADYLESRACHADWLALPGATPPECYYGFAHTRDEGCERILGAWEQLGLAGGGPLVDVERERAPYRGSQRLVSDLDEVPRGKFHSCIVHDNLTPIDAAGTPRYEPVWRHLLSIP